MRLRYTSGVGNTAKPSGETILNVVGMAVILLAYTLVFLTYWVSAVGLEPMQLSYEALNSNFTSANATDVFFLIYLLAPAYQAYRLFALSRLLGLQSCGRGIDSVASVSWLTSLFGAAYIAFPLANINMWIRYFGKVYEPRGYSWLLYGQNASSGIPELLIALAILILLDTLLFWELIAPGEKVFRRSLKAAIIVNAVSYGAAIFVFCAVPLAWFYLR